MKKRYEVKKQKNGTFSVIDNESKAIVVLNSGKTKPMLEIAWGMKKQDADSFADRMSLRNAWGV